MGWREQLRAVAGRRAAQLSTAPNVSEIAAQIYMFLLSQLAGADMPAGAKALVSAAVQPPVTFSESHAVIHINPVMRPSMFNQGNGGKLKGGKTFVSHYGGVDLVLVYNRRKAPKKTFFPARVNSKQRVVWAKMNGDQVKAYSNHYLESAVGYGMALHPDVEVFLSA